MKRFTLSALALALLALGACRPDPPPGAATSPATEAPTSAAPTTAAATTTTTSPPAELTGVSLGFNNAEQGVIAPDGTPLLVVMRLGSVEVVRGSDGEVVRVGGSGRVATAAITAAQSRVVVAWAETGPGEDPVVMAAVSEDSGRSFGPAQELGKGSGPSLAAAGDDIAAVWHTGRDGAGESAILLARLEAGESTWGAAARVDESTAAPVWASVDARGSTLVVAWRDNRTGPYTVWLRTSDDLGATWDAETQIDPTTSGDPDVCLDAAGTIWLGYHSRGGVYLSKSQDGGDSFVPPVQVGDGWFAHVACSTGSVAVAWEETTAPAKSPDAAKAAGWAVYTDDMDLLARGSAGAPDAQAATAVPVSATEYDLVWIEPDAEAGALTGTLHRSHIPA